jgi:predicted secreted Zn-dependent protease
MKITKEKLKQIIKEELELMEQEDDPKSVETRTEFAKKLRDLSLKISKASKIDAAELQLINSIFDAILEFANTNQGRQILKIINDFTDKKIK